LTLFVGYFPSASEGPEEGQSLLSILLKNLCAVIHKEKRMECKKVGG
jgi:hypothetical protein